MKILVIGEGCRDLYQYGTCDRIAPEAPAPVFVPTNVIENEGMALNVKNNLISLGADVEMVTNSNWADITKTRYVDSKSNHMIVRVDVNDKKFERVDLKGIDFSKYDCIAISDYDKGFLTEKDIKYISKQHKLTFLDTKKALGPWCKDITYIKINNYEFRKSTKQIGKTLEKNMIVTLGQSGATHLGINYPVEQVSIRDTSGAGDSFLSGLIVKYLKTKDITKAIQFANECATNVVQRRGVSVVECLQA